MSSTETPSTGTCYKIKKIMWRLIYFLFSAMLCSLTLLTTGQTRIINGKHYEMVDSTWYVFEYGHQYKVENSRIYLKFISGANKDDIDSLIFSKGCYIVDSTASDFYLVNIPIGSTALDFVEDFLLSNIVAIAEPTTIGVFDIEPNDYMWDGYLHHLKDEETEGGIDAYLAWEKGTGDESITIGILDNGTRIFHEDLIDNVWQNLGEDADGDGHVHEYIGGEWVYDPDDINGIDDDLSGKIDDFSGWDFYSEDNTLGDGSYNHGTSVSGYAGAKTHNTIGVCGVAGGWGSTVQGSKLLICRIGENNSVPINTALVPLAFNYAIHNDTKVINMSFSVAETQAIIYAINRAYFQNRFLVTSSGNDPNNPLAFPGNYDKVFAVGSCYFEGEDYHRSSFSSYGEGLMIVAPGEGTYTTEYLAYGNPGNGTSFSSPLVAGTAALILSLHPDFNNEDLEKVLCITAKKSIYYNFEDGYEYGSWNNHVGYGKLNANRALGIVVDISSNTALDEGNYIRDEIHVSNDATLTLESGSRFYLLKTGGLIIDYGSTLIIEDNVKIYGDVGNYIAIHGNVQVGQNVTFEKFGDGVGPFAGLYLSNNDLQVDLDQVTFNEATLHNNGSILNIANCEFNNCDEILSFRGNINVALSNFSNSWLFLTNQPQDENVHANVIECDFTSNIPVTFPAIDISYYDNFYIYDNKIIGYHNGIELWNSGNGIEGNQWIIENEIENCIFSAIQTYNSKASIKVNYVHDNYYGVRFLNNSNIVFIGDQDVGWDGQRIYDNISYEVYASEYSFPVTFKYNLIIDDDNLQGDPLLYFDYGLDLGSRGSQKDITENCWGNEFIASDDLYPPGFFIWEPIWCPNGTLNQQSDSAEVLFTDGKTQFEAQNYSDAIISFETVVNQYPQTKYAEAAMKELFVIEKFDNSDYLSLQQYYLNNDSIQHDSSLMILSDFLVNSCDIEIENWQTSIDHYDSTIANPAYIDDSVFAIIDLGFTYTLMNNSGNRGTVHTYYVEHIPQSYTDFQEKRNHLLSLLPQENNELISEEGLQIFETGDLLQNIPNPFSENTKIYYKLLNPCNAKIAIYDQYGRLIQILLHEYKDTGIYNIDVNCSELGSGIYYYVLYINSTLVESKKMVVIK